MPALSSLFASVASRFLKRDWERIFTFFSDRTAAICLFMHFLIFLALPFSLMAYVSDRMLGGNSSPPKVGSDVIIRMPEQVWSGFFWFANFYGALCGVVIVVFMLYQIWDRGFKVDPFLRSTLKAGLAVGVASGLPLKLVVNYMMIMPPTNRVSVSVLDLVDLTEIAFTPYLSISGPWFITKFLITCPFFFILLAVVHWRKAVTAKEVDNGPSR